MVLKGNWVKIKSKQSRRYAPLIGYAAIFLLICSFISVGSAPANTAARKSRTKNVVILVIDGPRHTETWGDALFTHIPNMAKTLKPQGTFFSHFYNDGYTYTSSGHTAITTGLRQPIDNNGLELPRNPSIFQYWLKDSRKPATAAWVIASKGKLSVLANTLNPEWQNQYQPKINCGTDGAGNGYRTDWATFQVAKQIFTEYQPNLVLINLLQPDGSGHAANWEAYLQGISASDQYAQLLWDFLQTNKNYKNKTALFITNDHGRHLDGILDGFVSHGDDCEGCRHISLLALGPDFPKNKTVEAPYNQTDIASTVARLLKFKISTGEGKIIKELFD